MKNTYKYLLLFVTMVASTACEEDTPNVAPAPMPSQVLFIHAQDTTGTGTANSLTGATAATFDSLVAFLGTELRLPYSVGALKYQENSGYVEYATIFESADPRLRGAVLDDNGELQGWSTRAINSQGTGAIESGKAYTFVALGFMWWSPFQFGVGDQSVWLEDDLTPPASGQAHVRVVHGIGDFTAGGSLAVAAPGINLNVGGNTPTEFQGLSFRGNSGFVPVNSGNQTMVVTYVGGPEILNFDETLDDGGIYTLVLSGVEDFASETFTLVKHN